MRNRAGVTFVEIMLGVLIMAAVIIPISRMISSVTSGTKYDRCEAEAMQFACDLMDNILMKMDYDPANIASSTWQIHERGQTDIRYKVFVKQIPWENITAPVIKYHPPCAQGVERTTLGQLESDITSEDRNLSTLDKETVAKLGLPSGLNNFDLCDIKVIVDWKPKGTKDTEFGKNPIILVSRKARL
ncbi:MAG: hypothetical protein Kow0029_06450 [Candidatus Rifleibacteriota bacterium]